MRIGFAGQPCAFASGTAAASIAINITFRDSFPGVTFIFFLPAMPR
jgi:hypothetical protein